MVFLLSRKNKYELLKDNWDGNNYKELAKLTGYSAEYVRKLGGKLSLPHKKMNKQSLPREDVVERVLEDRKDLHYRQQISILTKKNKSLMKQANLQETLLIVAKEQIEALPMVESPERHVTEDKVTKEIANLLLSDLHGGEKVDEDEMGGLNTYDMNVMAKRLECLSNSIISIKDKMKGYDLYHLNVNMLGDMLSGLIHDELREYGDGTVIEWTFNTALVVSQMLSHLLTVFPTIHVTCVVGNHGRMTKKVSYKGRYVNWDYIVYQTIALMMMNNPRITFDIPKSFWTIIKTGGRKQLLLHGDNIRCFSPETRITLSDFTSKHIKDICVGDCVLSHDGIGKKVVNIFKYKHDGEMVNIKCYYLNEPVFRATPNHKILFVPSQVINSYKMGLIAKNEITPEWTNAGHLSEGDYLVVPRPKIDNIINSIKTEDFVYPLPKKLHPNEKTIPKTLGTTTQLGLIMGQYLADGCTFGANKKVKGSNYNHITEVVFHEDEEKFWVDYCQAWEYTFNDKPKLITRHDMTIRAQRVFTYGQRAATLISNLCGRGSYDKCLHSSVFKWPIESLKSLLVGYLRGDGHTAKYKYGVKRLTHKVAATTMSVKLGQQLYWIALRCGYAPSFKIKTKSGKPMVVIVFYGDDARELGSLVQRNYQSNDNEYFKNNNRKKQTPLCIKLDDFVIVRVRSAWRTKYKGYKYDLSIEDKHTYTAGMVGVHNSWQNTPWYGIQRAVYKLMELLASRDMYFDDIIMGHFHNLGIVSRTKGRIVLNGSVIGGNEYSVGTLFASNDPYQLFYGIHPGKSRWSWDYQLDLTDGDKIRNPKYKLSKSLVVADQVKELFGGK